MKKDDFIIKEFIDHAFDLKSHLMEFLSIEEGDLDGFLENAKMDLASLHPGGSLSEAEDFYKEIVGDKHLADLAAWHISSKDYIADTLKLQQRFSRNLVLDFGGGIGTHSLANAMSTKVEHVFSLILIKQIEILLNIGLKNLEWVINSLFVKQFRKQKYLDLIRSYALMY